MRYFYAAIMLASSVLAFYYATRIFYNKNYTRKVYCLFSMTSIASAIWSLGYGMMQLTDDFKIFAIFRVVGLLGITLFMIVGQTMIAILQNKVTRLLHFLFIEIILAVMVLCVVPNPANYSMKMTSSGIITEFTSVSVSVFYTSFTVVIAALFIFYSFQLTSKENSKQNQVVGRTLLVVEFIILVGMVFDTLLPAVGINFNIPASSILQFEGIMIFYRAIHRYNKNILSIENMAGYIYKVLRVPVFVLDNHHNMVFANSSGREILKISETDKLSDSNIWTKINQLPPNNIGEAKEEIKIDITLEEENPTYLRLVLDPIFDEFDDFIGYIMIVNDLTEHYQNTMLQESTKFKTQFLANMSHEIRTPLNAILGFNDALLQHSSEVDKVRSYASSIHEAGNSLKNIINSILDISKIEMGQLEIDSKEYSTIELLDNLTSMFELLAKKKGLNFTTEIDDNLPEVLIGDEQHLRQILTNILSNAVKYTDFGSVTLRVNVISHDKDTYVSTIRFSVKDTGRGIKEEDREKLFEKFGRLDREHFKNTEGTGLGMSIVLLTLQEMGSKIEFDSVYGEGTDFYFDLDQLALGEKTIGDFRERRKEIAVKTISNNNFRAPKAKILIVDDVEMNIEATLALLEFTKMKIDRATSGREALEMVKSKEYNIIFMDHMMPEMDGIETTEKIRNLSVETQDAYFAMVPVIALTANAIVGMREIFQDAGMQDFVSKPIELSAIIAALKKWLPQEYIEKASEEEMHAIQENADFGTSKETDSWNIEINGIDIAEAKKYNSNKVGFEKNMRSFERSYETNKTEIEYYFDDNDIQDYVIKVHGLKSTSKMIGAMELSETARQIEERGRSGEADEEEYRFLMKLYDKCVKNLRAYFYPLGAEESQDSGDAISEEEYNQLLVRIKTAADALDMGEFMNLEEELLNIPVDLSHKEEINNLQSLISTLEFSQVSEYLANRR